MAKTKKEKKADSEVAAEKAVVDEPEEEVIEAENNVHDNDPKSDDDEKEGMTKEEKAAAKKKKKKEKEKEKKRTEKDGEAGEENMENEVPNECSETPEPKEDSDGENVDDSEDKAAAKKKKKKAKEKEKKEKEKEKKEKKEKEKKDGGKGKQKRLIQELLQARQAAEEAQQRAAEEEERRLQEIQRLKEEAEKREQEKKEEAKRRKAELIQQQKREGTFLTKKQRQQQERARSLFQNQNVILPPAITGDEKPKKPYYGKKRPPKKTQPQESVEEPMPTIVTLEEKKDDVEDVTKKVEKIVVDDWEELSDSDVSEMADAAIIVEEKKLVPVTVAHTKKGDKDEAGQVQRITKADDIGKRGSVESESESSSDEDSSDESTDSEEVASTAPSVRETREMLFAKVRNKIAKRRELAHSKRDFNNLRSPIICVLGHVDTGKTKMLDTIRSTNVQDGEAGGITQQIGATDVPSLAIVERCKQVKDFDVNEIKIPGFLIIDTPGHESFANLRSRGSSLCDIAILVVDIMHGLEPQTIESLKLLLKRKTPFVVALNKVDRLYGYESNPRKDIYQHLKAQSTNVQLEFKERWEKIVTEFAEQGLNVTLSKDNKDFDEYVSVVPTSAQLGDGIGNLMAHIVYQSQIRIREQLIFSEELNCIVMEVRAIAGLGTTIDVILVNGHLRNDDIIVLSGIDGPIVTAVRDLLTPPPLKEMRIKSDYHHFKEIKGAQGVKVLAKDLEKAVAGLPLFVAHSSDELEVLKKDAEEQLSTALMAIKKKPEGVYVQASTLGSLEALLEFLKTQKIPYSNVNIGPVHKKDVQRAAAMLEHNKEFACILAFDVPITREAQQVADKEGVRIFQANIIYHLEDSFLKYREELRLKRRRENEHLAIYPAKLRILPQNIFNARNPIVIGVSVEAGHLKKGTPICAKTIEGNIMLGTVSSIERNHDQMDVAKPGDEVCVKIENTTGDAPKMYGRHFTHTDVLISRISRESIDVCKTYFRDDLTRADWQLIVELKKILDIM